MGTRVKVFTDLLVLVTKKSQKRCGRSAMGMFDGREVVFALPSSSSETAKICLVVDVYLAAVMKFPGVPYASLHCSPLLDEDFHVDSQVSDALPVVFFCVPL